MAANLLRNLIIIAGGLVIGALTARAEPTPQTCQNLVWQAPKTTIGGQPLDLTGGGYRIYGKYGETYQLLDEIRAPTLTVPILSVVTAEGKHDLFVTAYTAEGLESSYGVTPLRVNILNGVPVVIGIPSTVTGISLQCTIIQ